MANSPSAESARETPWYTWPWSSLVVGFWFYQIVGWLVLIVGSFPFKLHFMAYNWGEVLLVTAVRDIPGFFYTLWLRRVYRSWGPNIERRPTVLVALILVLSILGAVADMLYVWLIGQRIGPEMLQSEDYQLMTFGYRLFVFTIWSLLYFGIRAILHRQRQAEALREAEMQMLRAQINPHFFFNALNTIQAGAGRDPKALSELVQNLAGYLRYTLKHRENLLVPLGEEYDASLSYLAVEKARFCEGLEVECFIDAQLRKALVPGVLLQPLLENAIKHGRRTSESPLRVILEVKREGEELLVLVANTGEWVPESKTGGAQVSGVGLQNLRRRLRLCYPEGNRLSVECEGGWVRVKLCLSTVERTRFPN